MQVSVEVLDGLERRLTVEVPAQRIDEEIQKRLRDLKGQVRLDGFRPGKVPLKVLQGKYGRSVRDEVTNETVRDSYFEALRQEALEPAGDPSIELSPSPDGEVLRFLATIEVLPTIEVGAVEGFEIHRPAVEISAEDVDTMVERLRKQRADWVEVERPAVEGDQVKMDFTGRVDGEVFQGGEGTDATVILGSGNLIPGFESGLEGLSPGEDKTITVTFPQDYQAEELAGREASFEVQVKSVAEPHLPEVDDAFARNFGVDEGGVGTLRAELERSMQGELRRGIGAQLKQQVMKCLLDANEVELPKAMVDAELRSLAEQSGMVEQDPKRPVELNDSIRELFTDRARERVSLGLIMGELIKREGIEVDQTRVQTHVEGLASSYNEPEQVRELYRTNPRAQQSARSAVLEEQVVDWVLERAQVIDEPKSFTEVMDPKKEASQAGDD